MKPGTMLERLHKVEDELPELLREFPDAWESLDVNYEPPRVERLWRQHGDLRIYLHRIHPCEEALYHPHPWPSAIRILSGRYEMGVAESPMLRSQAVMRQTREVAKLVIGPGAQYEMVNPIGWHYVRPLDEPSLSLMVTAKPWDPPIFKHDDFGKTVKLEPLSGPAKAQLLADFRHHYHYWRANR